MPVLESEFRSAEISPTGARLVAVVSFGWQAALLHLQRGPVAQLAEQQTLNLRVVGSIPTRLTR